MLDRFAFRSRGDELVLGVLEPLVPQSARVALDLALARQLRAEIDAEGLTYRELAERHGWSRMKVMSAPAAGSLGARHTGRGSPT
jgi:hypothetical protein